MKKFFDKIPGLINGLRKSKFFAPALIVLLAVVVSGVITISGYVYADEDTDDWSVDGITYAPDDTEYADPYPESGVSLSDAAATSPELSVVALTDPNTLLGEGYYVRPGESFDFLVDVTLSACSNTGIGLQVTTRGSDDWWESGSAAQVIYNDSVANNVSFNNCLTSYGYDTGGCIPAPDSDDDNAIAGYSVGIYNGTTTTTLSFRNNFVGRFEKNACIANFGKVIAAGPYADYDYPATFVDMEDIIDDFNDSSDNYDEEYPWYDFCYGEWAEPSFKSEKSDWTKGESDLIYATNPKGFITNAFVDGYACAFPMKYLDTYHSSSAILTAANIDSCFWNFTCDNYAQCISYLNPIDLNGIISAEYTAPCVPETYYFPYLVESSYGSVFNYIPITVEGEPTAACSYMASCGDQSSHDIDDIPQPAEISGYCDDSYLMSISMDWDDYDLDWTCGLYNGDSVPCKADILPVCGAFSGREYVDSQPDPAPWGYCSPLASIINSNDSVTDTNITFIPPTTTTTTTTTTYTWNCLAGGNTSSECSHDVDTVVVFPPIGDLEIDDEKMIPSIVNEGQQCTFSWDITDVEGSIGSCQVHNATSGDLVGISQPYTTSADDMGQGVDPKKEYYVECTNDTQTIRGDKTLKCNINPTIIEN